MYVCTWVLLVAVCVGSLYVRTYVYGDVHVLCPLMSCVPALLTLTEQAGG